jgi:hypothetical protein
MEFSQTIYFAVALDISDIFSRISWLQHPKGLRHNCLLQVKFFV